MHESIFSYTVAKPYPFKWFTPLVLVAGSLVPILVTFFSIATSGYEMITIYSYNPNATEMHQIYFSNWPSFMSANTRPSCQSNTISVASSFFTNNTAFSYTVKSIWQGDESNPNVLAGSLTYHNNQFQNCSIPGIQITWNTADLNPAQDQAAMASPNLNAYITCSVNSPNGLFNVNMTTAWGSTYGDSYFLSLFTQFPGVNQTSASLWWGQSIMAWYYEAFAYDLQTILTNYTIGKLDMTKTTVPATSNDQIKSLDFFSSDCYFNEGESGYDSGGMVCMVSQPISLRLQDNITLPLWLSVDTLTKAMYYTILADLGQTDSRYPNMLESPELLEYYTSNFSTIQDTYLLYQSTLALGPYTQANASEWDLGVRPSVVSTAYLCQIPQLKQGGNLLVGILVADLVLLQLIWKISTFIINFIISRKYPEINYCQGCQNWSAGSHTAAQPEISSPKDDSGKLDFAIDDTASGKRVFQRGSVI
ncbi:hypothetical protein BX600DRAFT_441954 [Xylariales sp. PMI_506]|nr:hypothetical protein BX600DRAFT_441954 [Xylariales sp. PMI_506]